MHWKPVEYTTKKVPTKWIIVKGQVRKGHSEENLRDLAASLLADGQLQPIGCLKDGTLLWGERRVRAALLVGIEFLEAKIFESEPSETDRLILQTAENKHENLKAWESWLAIEDAARLNPHWSNQDIAQAFSIDASRVTRLRSAGRTVPPVQEAFKEGKLGLSTVYAISKLPEAEQADALAKALSGATREEIDATRRRPPNGELKGARLSRAKLVLPSGVQVVISGAKLSLDDVLDTLTSLLEAARRAVKDRLDLKTLVAVLADKAKAGG